MLARAWACQAIFRPAEGASVLGLFPHGLCHGLHSSAASRLPGRDTAVRGTRRAIVRPDCQRSGGGLSLR